MGDAGKITYHDVKALVLSRIRDRIWPPGSIVPGEIELAEELGCARATVNRAMRELAEDGLIERRRKAGTRVRPAPVRQAKLVIPLIREEIEAGGHAYGYTLLRRDRRVAPAWLRAALNLDQAAPVLHLQCLHRADARPYQFENRWINLDLVPAAESADFSVQGPNDWLVSHMPFTRADISFSAEAADDQVAAALSATPGAALFTVERTTWLENGPITFARLSFAPGYRMTSTL